MLILGIDPGSRYCGYGLLEIQKKRIIAAGCDVIDVSREKDILKRLNMLYSAVDAILDEYNTDVATVERMFLQRHVRSLFHLGHARGVILLSIARHNLQMLEYSPREIKKAVVGNGNASKQQVRYMVSKQPNRKSATKRDDAYDALGIALCHYHCIKYEL